MDAIRIQKLLKQVSDRIKVMMRFIHPFNNNSTLDQIARRLEAFADAVQAADENASLLTLETVEVFHKEVDVVETLIKQSSLSRISEPRSGYRSKNGAESLSEDLENIRNRLRGLQIGLNAVAVPLESDLPGEPVQGHGPHFFVSGGRLDFAPAENLDPTKNDIPRIRSLLPVIRVELDDALSLFGRNIAHARIHRCLLGYSEAVNAGGFPIDFNLVAAYGTLLANAEKASLRDISDRLAPELEDSEKAALGSILDLHGPLLLATEIGREYLSDAAEYNRTPDQQAVFRAASVDLATAIAEEGIATERTETFLVETAANIGAGSHPSRAASLGTNTIRNVSAVMVLGALTLFPTQLATTAQWIAAVLIAEGAKRSSIGQEAANVVRDAIDDPKQLKNLMKLAPFILKHETKLRAIAGDQREFRFLHQWLDWFKAQSIDEQR